MNNKNHYQLLNVDYTADQLKLKEEHRNLVKKLHPDLHKNDPSLQEKIALINNAYDVLKNSGKRRDYDLENIKILLNLKHYQHAFDWASGSLSIFPESREVHQIYIDAAILLLNQIQKEKGLEQAKLLLDKIVKNKNLYQSEIQQLSGSLQGSSEEHTQNQQVVLKKRTAGNLFLRKCKYYFLLGLRNEVIFISWAYFHIASFIKQIILKIFNIILNMSNIILPYKIGRLIYWLEKGIYVSIEWVLDLLYKIIHWFVLKIVNLIDRLMR